jgi:deoxyribodipyrimidine photolyase
MKQTFLQKLDKKLMKNKVVTFINQKGREINNFSNRLGKEDWNMNIKSHTISKKFTPFEEKLLEATG